MSLRGGAFGKRHDRAHAVCTIKQSRCMSLVEAVANVLVGYGVAVATQVLVFPLFGIAASLSENLAIGGVFTLVSIFRSYFLRRAFEAIRVQVQTNTARR